VLERRFVPRHLCILETQRDEWPAVATTTLSASAQQIVAAGSLTNQRTIKNTDASITIYLGPSGVTASNGYPLKPGETITFDARNTSAALFAVAASGTPVVSAIGF
jgi:hypothetical protein